MLYASKQICISVVIPCYNSGHYLLEAIASVKQYPKHSICEIIIVNDGSDNQETISVLASLQSKGYKVYHQDNKGPAGARNTGVRQANGTYVLLLDSDNRIRPEYISTGIRILDENPEDGVVYGNPCFFGELGEERFGKAEPFDMTRLIVDNYIANCSVIRKSVLDEVGLLDERLRYAMDYELWLRISANRKHRFKHTNQNLAYYRVHGASKTGSEGGMKKFYPEWQKVRDTYLHEASFFQKLQYYTDWYSHFYWWRSVQLFKKKRRGLKARLCKLIGHHVRKS